MENGELGKQFRFCNGIPQTPYIRRLGRCPPDVVESNQAALKRCFRLTKF